MKKLLKILSVLLCFYTGLLIYNLISSATSSIKFLDENLIIEREDLDIENHQDDVYVLVNENHELNIDYKVKLISLEGIQVSKELKKPLEQLLKDARNDGISIELNQGYRSREHQQEIFDSKVAEYVDKGFSYNNASIQANKMVASVGHSEHETGLAIDFVSSENENDKFDMWEWLMNNAYKYGFIQRYPAHKTHITKVVYEPWHYRYLGQDIALYMKQQDLVLEEIYEFLE